MSEPTGLQCKGYLALPSSSQGVHPGVQIAEKPRSTAHTYGTADMELMNEMVITASDMDSDASDWSPLPRLKKIELRREMQCAEFRRDWQPLFVEDAVWAWSTV